MNKLPIEIPEWLTYLKDDAGISSKDLVEILGYKTQNSFISGCVRKGNFSQPDFQGKKIARGGKIFFWKKSTVLKEIERINNGIKLDVNIPKHDIIKMGDACNIAAESRIIHTEYLS